MTRKEFLKLIVKNPLLLFTKTSRLSINELEKLTKNNS
jgi:hypothetical protein